MFRQATPLHFTKAFFTSLCLAIAGLHVPAPAVALDLDALSRLLLPANLALMLANACTAADPAFSRDLGGPNGTVPEYAQRVKDAVSEHLTSDQVQIVLRRAADDARAAALRAVRALAASDEAEEQMRVQDWCATTVKPFVRAFLKHSDENVDDFLQHLARAKAK
jgi:hypothetical protein